MGWASLVMGVSVLGSGGKAIICAGSRDPSCARSRRNGRRGRRAPRRPRGCGHWSPGGGRRRLARAGPRPNHDACQAFGAVSREARWGSLHAPARKREHNRVSQPRGTPTCQWPRDMPCTTARPGIRTLAEDFERRRISDRVEGPAGNLRVEAQGAPRRLADFLVVFLEYAFHVSFRRLFRLSFGFRPRRSLSDPIGAVGERRPRRFGPPATLAHMVERCRFRLGPRLFGAGEEEFEVGAADDRLRPSLFGLARRLAAPAGRSRRWSASHLRPTCRLTAAILPRRSCCRS